MTQAVEQLLATFDGLTEAEKHVAAVEVLRRASPAEDEPLTDEALVAIADELFLELDRQEAADGSA